MIVRDYEQRDRDACRALFEELLETHRVLYSDAEIAGEFTPAGRLFVAEEDERVVGYAGVLLDSGRAELEPIVVAPGTRGRGVGRALAERVVEEARSAGAVKVFVRPAARNREAIGFFHDLGFDVLGYVQLQIDLEPRERRLGECIADRSFRV